MMTSAAKVYKREFCGSNCLAFKTITPKFQSFWHTHQEFEMVYIESGSGILQYGKQQHPYKKGDFFILGPWVPHEFFESSQYHVSISLLFNNNFIMPGFFDCEMTHGIRQLLDKTIFGMLFREKISNYDTDMLQMILNKTGIDRAISLLALLNSLSSYQAENLLENNNNEQPAHLKKFAKIQDILSYINKNSHKKLMLNDIAEQFFMSTSHFARFFQTHTQTTFSQYVIGLRIEKACYLLAHTELPITQISQDIGFDSLSSFNRAFLRLTNTTPSQYRKR